MEFIDADRPRFLFQARAAPPPPPPSSSSSSSSSSTSDQRQQLNKPFLFVTTALSAVLISLSLLYVSEPFQSLLLWLSLSLLVGPFAPSSLTGGSVRVGRGPIVEFPDQQPQVVEETKRKPSQKRPKGQPPGNNVAFSPPIAEIDEQLGKKIEGNGLVIQGKSDLGFREKEKDWSEDEIELLRKQLVKHPAGKPRRWEIIAEAFNGGHRLESVIKKAKELADKKSSDKDSYAQFLKNRKPLDERLNEGADGNGSGEVRRESEWSSAEDIALLNALKAFPKDALMRWEKIAAAVPGKTKVDCVKRVSELKKDFRSSKAAKEGQMEE
ncbi:transcription factor MAMYB [Rhodamnia argentea]|uniref:Transcription factor MAMYB n=1 Tax=Rhodamnia argentea TaxID=178133 RepID=A0A8B8PGF7_9MYRT|nr:transcription factor MAMYB [Rhodamnia argentea]